MLKRGVERSYNRLSVDGDTSTNDTLVLLANGASGVRPDPRELPAVEEGIARVMESLAQAIARDGEGARKFITIVVSGASNNDGAARDGARHRQFAAGEDGGGGLRSQLGPHPLAPRAMPEWPSILPKPTSTCKASWCAAAAWRRHFPSPS